MKALTARQQEVFDLIRDHISQTGMPPTRAEIAQRLGFRSPNAAEEHLKALARKGVIEIVSGASRGINHAVFMANNLFQLYQRHTNWVRAESRARSENTHSGITAKTRRTHSRTPAAFHRLMKDEKYP